MLRIVYIIILIALSVTYIGGCRRAGKWLVKDDVPVHADAMVLLMGSFPERVMQAADLYNTGRANWLIIVHESMGPYKLLESKGANVVSTTEQARNAAVALGIPAESVTILPGDARSTQTEAIIVRDYLKVKAGTDTLILVSSPSHMRRASMIFNAVFKDAETHVYIGCSPSAYSSFNPEKWWCDKEGVQTVLSEYVKIFNFIVFERGRLSGGEG